MMVKKIHKRLLLCLMLVSPNNVQAIDFGNAAKSVKRSFQKAKKRVMQLVSPEDLLALMAVGFFAVAAKKGYARHTIDQATRRLNEGLRVGRTWSCCRWDNLNENNNCWAWDENELLGYIQAGAELTNAQLEYAARHRRYEVVARLLNSGIVPSRQLLFHVLQRNDQRLIRLFAPYLEPQELQREGLDSLLSPAIQNRNLVSVRYLVEQGVPVREADILQVIPNYLLNNDNNLEIFSYLLDQKDEFSDQFVQDVYARLISSRYNVQFNQNKFAYFQRLVAKGLFPSHQRVQWCLEEGNQRYFNLFYRPEAFSQDLLNLAIRHNINAVGRLLQNRPEDSLSGEQFAILVNQAIQANSFPIVCLLVEHGAPVTDRVIMMAMNAENMDLFNAWLTPELDISVAMINQAIDSNNSVALQQLLDHQNRPDNLDACVARAVDKNRLDLVALLVEHGAPVSNDCIFLAIKKQSLSIVKLLLEHGADPNKKSANMKAETPLYLAANKGNVAIISLLLEKSADIKIGAGIWNISPLQEAAAAGHCEVVDLLIERGADINQADLIGHTPLFMACERGHLEIANRLVENGAILDQKVNAPCRGFPYSFYRFPLIVAAKNKHWPVVDLLVEKGANCLVSDGYHGTVFDYLIEGDASDSLIKKCLVGCTLPIRECDRIFNLAVIRGYDDIVKIFLKKSVNINIRDAQDKTPLMHAAEKKYKNLVDLLIKNGASKELKDNYGQTALHYAMRSGGVTESLVGHLLTTTNQEIAAEQDELMRLSIKYNYASLVRKLINKGVNPVDHLSSMKLSQIKKMALANTDLWGEIQTFLSKSVQNGTCNICLDDDVALCHIVCPKKGCKNNVCQNCFEQFDKRNCTTKCLLCRQKGIFALEDYFNVSLPHKVEQSWLGNLATTVVSYFPTSTSSSQSDT